MRRGRRINAARRRVRKQQLARRHGQRCGYCRCPFADLAEATLDHVVPCSLWWSWSVTSLVLACWDCNQAKADRFPLSIALLLAARYPVHGELCVFTAGTSTVHGATSAFSTTADVFTDQSGVFTGGALTDCGEPAVPSHVESAVHVEPVVLTERVGVFTLGVWRLLARLAHAHQEANPPTLAYDRHPPGRVPDHPESAPGRQHRSAPDLRDEARHTPRHTLSGMCPTGPSDHHRPHRSIGADVGSTGVAVCA
ncbi:HNH endonuclease [Streptomyces sp. NPDC049906]|uniref:HNH endonuclease n=1 Tax=Streptomyces sp. NPDC049906 TaxID=3155656 RepID=UPI003448E67C